MKLKKKSGLIGLISVLAGVSVVSVGFAAWVVSAGDTQTLDGEIHVETMEDERHTISGLSASLAHVKYGAPGAAVSTTVTGQVLSYRNVAATEVENLDIEFSFKVRNLSTAKYTITLAPKSGEGTGSVWYNADAAEANKFKTTETEGYTKLTGYEAAYTRGYVGELPAYNSATSSATNIEVEAGSEDGNHDTLISVTLHFKWGSKFKGSYLSDAHNGGEIVNPFTFYNKNGSDNLSYSVEQKNAAAADAVATLGNLNSYLTAVGYTMTIVTEHNA